MDDVSHNSLERVLRKIADDMNEFDKFVEFHRVSAEDKDCRGPCREQFLCSIEYVNAQEWETCMNDKYRDSNGCVKAGVSIVSLAIAALFLLVVN